MKSIEEEEIRLEYEVLKKRQGLLHEREREIWKHNQNADAIVADETLMKADITEGEVNYILGQSAGYVDGFRAAIDAIINALSSKYRDIPMTEHELYMLTELGEIKERAWLKDYKQRQIIKKAGWKVDYMGRCPLWLKKSEKVEEGEE